MIDIPGFLRGIGEAYAAVKSDSKRAEDAVTNATLKGKAQPLYAAAKKFWVKDDHSSILIVPDENVNKLKSKSATS